EHSFDISAVVDMMEVKNALETAKKEIAARYDFKGLAAEVELNEKEKFITLLSSSDNKIDALKDTVISKLIKRNIPPVAITATKREPASGGNLKATLKLNDTHDSENSKKNNKANKDTKIKVSAQIRGEEIRVTSKSIDELQECIKLVRG
uniref:YajQ family cyclic di-GMP-binding protein n=1 Tax=Campylobacter concisus TaxID=199 RepID=UPI000CD97176